MALYQPFAYSTVFISLLQYTLFNDENVDHVLKANSDGENAIHIAAKEGSTKVIHALIGHLSRYIIYHEMFTYG